MAALTIDGNPAPGVSRAAKQMGPRAAQNTLARIAGKLASHFKYIDYGSLATTGYQSAVWLPGPVKLLRVPA
jgi:NADH dehydrogenase FAD-containing subunit